VNDSCTGFVLARNAHDNPSLLDGLQHFGLNQAQVGEGFRGPGLRCVMKFWRNLGRTVIDASGQKRISFLLSFLFFHLLRK
jgi:hypothetical protein